jgi:hypothetical protein
MNNCKKAACLTLRLLQPNSHILQQLPIRKR